MAFEEQDKAPGTMRATDVAAKRLNSAWLERSLIEDQRVDDALSYTGFLARTAQKFPDKPALIFQNSMYTYRELFRKIRGVSDYLRTELGIRSGQRVALLLDNSDRYQIWYLAVVAIGAVAVPINTKLTGGEITFLLDDSAPAAIVSEEKFEGTLSALDCVRLGKVRCVQCDDLTANLAGPQDDRAAPVRTTDPAAIYYTSGTTGRPKGVVHSHRSMIAATVQGPRCWEYDDPAAVTLAMTPLFHIANHTWFLPVLHVGGTMVIDVFRTEATLDLIERLRITHLFAVPTMLILMTQRARGGAYTLPRVRTVAFGAAPMPPEKLADVQRLFPGAGLVHGMGQTESCGTIVTLPSCLAFQKAGSVGVNIDGADIRTVDEKDTDVVQNVVGELVTRGPSTMSHYHNQQDATEETLRNGWLHTGDLGYLDKDGFLFLVDRKKDMINRGGEKIYSSEVENVLYMHPGVLQAAVVAGKSELFGEEVFAFVVRKKEASELDEEAIRAHCTRHLASFKVPVGVRFVGELPATATGKVQKHTLREQLPPECSWAPARNG